MIPLHIAESDKLDEWVELNEQLNRLKSKSYNIRKEYDEELRTLKNLLTYNNKYTAGIVDNVYVVYDEYKTDGGVRETQSHKDHIWTYSQKIQNISNRLIELSGQLLSIQNEYDSVSEEMVFINKEAQKKFEQESS